MGFAEAEALFGCGFASTGAASTASRAVSQAVGRSFFCVLVLHTPLGQENLAVGWQLDVVWSVKIFEHLLRHPLEHRCGNLSALVQADRRIQNDRHRNSRIVYRSESRERSHVLGMRIRARGGINLLPGAGFSGRTVAFESRRLSRSVLCQNDPLHHSFHQRRCHGRDDPSLRLPDEMRPSEAFPGAR